MFNVEPGNPPAHIVVTNGVQVTRLKQAADEIPRLSGETDDPAALRQYLMDGVVFARIAEAAVSTRLAVTLEAADLFSSAAHPVGQLLGIYPGTKPIHDQLLDTMFCNAWTRAASLL